MQKGFLYSEVLETMVWTPVERGDVKRPDREGAASEQLASEV